MVEEEEERRRRYLLVVMVVMVVEVEVECCGLFGDVDWRSGKVAYLSLVGR